MAPRRPAPEVVVRGARSAAVNFGIIGLVVIAGVLIANAGTGIANDLGIPSDLLAVALLGIVVTLIVPAGIVLWRVLCELDALYIRRALVRFDGSPGLRLAEVAGTGIISLLLLASGVWLVTRLSDMMSVGNVTSPVPALVMVFSAGLTATLATKVHSQMDRTFRRTLLGDAEDSGAG